MIIENIKLTYAVTHVLNGTQLKTLTACTHTHTYKHTYRTHIIEALNVMYMCPILYGNVSNEMNALTLNL